MTRSPLLARRLRLGLSSLLVPALLLGLLRPATSAAAEATDEVPVRAITLYRSGVGYFEHQGSVKGERTVSLRFDADKINDILKSLVLLDGARGVRGVSYSSKDPLDRRLASFGINIGDNPSLAEIMKRLRGAQVKLVTAEGPIEGTILGTEVRRVVAGGTHEGGGVAVDEPHVNLITPAGVRCIAVSRVSTFEIADPKLQAELAQALAALAAARAERSATVDIAFGGEDERTVVIGYVHEAPVWKTTYRLLLPEEATQPTHMQGWAIVENATDQDWRDVRLALAAGNPVGFIMDLHSPLYVGRPTIAVPVMGFVGPREYESGSELRSALESAPAPAGGGVRMRGRAVDRMGQAFAPGPSTPPPMADAAEPATGDWQGGAPEGQATAGEVGEQFRYDIREPVTIARQRSAMLPILSSPLEGQRLSIYNPNDQREHPMRGVEIRNTTAFELAPGPISVFDGGAYAGDAQIGFTSRGQSRLLAYAVDLDVRALMTSTQAQSLERIRIVNGLLEQELKNRRTTQYRFINRDTRRGRTILVERQKTAGWDVVKPAEMASESETLRRYKLPVEANAEGVLDVVEEQTQHVRIAVAATEVAALVSFAQSGKASEAVKAVIQEAARLQSAINVLQAKQREVERERDDIGRDQARIRENMSRIDRQSDLFSRYMQRLGEQESRLETLLVERDKTIAALQAATEQRDEYLRTARAD